MGKKSKVEKWSTTGVLWPRARGPRREELSHEGSTEDRCGWHTHLFRHLHKAVNGSVSSRVLRVSFRELKAFNVAAAFAFQATQRTAIQ